MNPGAPSPLLLQALRSPASLPALLESRSDELFRQAERARLQAWLAEEIGERGLEALLPPPVLARVRAARAVGREFDRAVRWEVNRLRRALDGVDTPFVLLKGAAYVCAGLPLARGRLVADIDVLVPRARLGDVEAALLEHGWAFEPLESYDVRYYRRWMHELPPLRHQQRRAQLDVHHAILPATARLNPDPSRLIERSVAADACGVRVLCPSHLFLHAATHLFQDGEIAGSLRDLFDLHRLLTYFGDREGFWSDVIGEAQALHLTRPAYYGVRYAAQLCPTPVPAAVRSRMDAWAPAAPTLALMDRLVAGAFSGSGLASWCLYVRAHWLRMPPWLLARHLLIKGWRRTGLGG